MSHEQLRTSNIPPSIERASTGFTIAGIYTDILVHTSSLDLPCYYPVRHALPNIISEHIGNFSTSVAWLYAFWLVSHDLITRGVEENNPHLINRGYRVQQLGIVFTILGNLAVEHQYIFNHAYLQESTGDIGVGLIAVILTSILMNAANKRDLS
jgi:hypothetical protein